MAEGSPGVHLGRGRRGHLRVAIPKFTNCSDVWPILDGLSAAQIVWLVLAQFLGRAAYWSVYMRALVVAVAGVAIYLVLPRLAAMLGSWPRLSTLSPIWFSVAVAVELASFTCNFALQRLALQTKGWLAVVTAGLAGNAVTDSLPGGDAAGAAVQFGMLTTAGWDTDTAVGALTTFALLGVGGLLALPHPRAARHPGLRAGRPRAHPDRPARHRRVRIFIDRRHVQDGPPAICTIRPRLIAAVPPRATARARAGTGCPLTPNRTDDRAISTADTMNTLLR